MSLSQKVIFSMAYIGGVSCDMVE